MNEICLRSFKSLERETEREREIFSPEGGSDEAGGREMEAKVEKKKKKKKKVRGEEGTRLK